MLWVKKSFAELTAGELYAILALRQKVFVVEQTCAFLDADGLDEKCQHLFAQDASGEILAYLRILPLSAGSDALPPAVTIGRVVTAPQVRGTGLGRELMQRGLQLVQAQSGPVPVHISAQSRLERFYTTLGFVRASGDYDEGGIPHLAMRRAADSA